MTAACQFNADPATPGEASQGVHPPPTLSLLRETGVDPGSHSRLLWEHYREAVHDAARHLFPSDKALLIALWRSAGEQWTEIFCSELVPKAAATQLRTISKHDPCPPPPPSGRVEM